MYPSIAATGQILTFANLLIPKRFDLSPRSVFPHAWLKSNPSSLVNLRISFVRGFKIGLISGQDILLIRVGFTCLKLYIEVVR